MLLVHVGPKGVPCLKYLRTESTLMHNACDVGFNVLLHCILKFAGELTLSAVPGGFHFHGIIA